MARIESLQSVTDLYIREQLNNARNMCRIALESLSRVKLKPAGFNSYLFEKRCKTASHSLFENFNTEHLLVLDETILNRTDWQSDEEDKDVIICTVETSSEHMFEHTFDMIVKFDPETDKIIYCSFDEFETRPEIIESENRQAQELLPKRLLAANDFYKDFINDFNSNYSDQYSLTNPTDWHNRLSATRWQRNVDLKASHEDPTTVDITLYFADDSAEIINGEFDGREIMSMMSVKDVPFSPC